jgi:hypothetical protein
VGLWLLRGLGLGVAAVGLGVFLWVSLQRIRYPLDLEWMESGMMCHALRLLLGQGIYVPPSVDFIPHLYTPLYPALLALLGKLTGDVSYLAARLVSLLSFVGALGLGVYWVRREGGSLVVALLAMAIPAATFAETGGFFDLARADSLQLFLTVLGAVLAHTAQGRTPVTVAAGVVLTAAFFAKQTAAPLAVGIALPLLLFDRKQAVVLGAVGVLGFACGSLLLNRWSDGWFWTYIFRLHQSHPFYAQRAFVETPKTLILILGPSLLLCLWAGLAQGFGRLGERDSRGLWVLLWLGLCGMATSCLGFGTQWAHVNAYIPGVFFPALAIGVAAGRLLSRPSTSRPGSEAGAKLLRELLVLGPFVTERAPAAATADCGAAHPESGRLVGGGAAAFATASDAGRGADAVPSFLSAPCLASGRTCTGWASGMCAGRQRGRSSTCTPHCASAALPTSSWTTKWKRPGGTGRTSCCTTA